MQSSRLGAHNQNLISLSSTTNKTNLSFQYSKMGSNPKAVIYLARHGKTIGNTQRIFLNPDEDGLNETGKLQACLLGQYLSSIKFTRVYSSTYLRAMETSKVVVSKSESPVEIVFDERLREWDHREFIGRSFDDAHSLKGQGVSDNDPYKEFVVPGTEQPEEVISRLKSFVSELLLSLKGTEASEKILIISHGFAISILMKHLKLSEDFDLVKFENQLYQKHLTNTGYHKLLIKIPTSDLNESEPESLINAKALIEFIDVHQDSHLQELELLVK